MSGTFYKVQFRTEVTRGAAGERPRANRVTVHGVPRSITTSWTVTMLG
ncbi:hypothetical protein ACIQVK_00720 [Streptomyces sp. NPDC090493]